MSSQATPVRPGKAFKVNTKHDWAIVQAPDEATARMKFMKFFGMRSTDHEIEVTATSEKPGKHSGQKNVDVKLLTE